MKVEGYDEQEESARSKRALGVADPQGQNREVVTD
jgi:hypothetical protein